MASENGEAWRKALPKAVEQYSQLINENWNSFTIDLQQPTSTAVNVFILHRIVHYNRNKYADTNLWEYFREDFEDWKLDTWRLGHKDIIRELRSHLRRYGVFVKKDGNRIRNNLQDIIESKQELV